MPPGPGRYPEGAPPRFVLLEKGQFFVGGQRQVAGGSWTARSSRRSRRAWRGSGGCRASARRSRSARAAAATGCSCSASIRWRSRRPAIPRGRARAPAARVAAAGPRRLRSSLAALPAARLVPAGRAGRSPARRLPPVELRLPARGGRQRPRGPRRAGRDWPHGVDAASICAGQQRYVVTLRPLLPGERP